MCCISDNRSVWMLQCKNITSVNSTTSAYYNTYITYSVSTGRLQKGCTQLYKNYGIRYV